MSDPRRVELVIDHVGRPPTNNQRRREHWRTTRRNVEEWRDAGIMAARLAKVAPFDAAAIEVFGRYPDRRALPDPDALAPALKAVLDGLVHAGVLTDDRAPYVRSVTYLPPVVDPGCRPALVVTLTAAVLSTDGER